MANSIAVAILSDGIEGDQGCLKNENNCDLIYIRVRSAAGIPGSKVAKVNLEQTSSAYKFMITMADKLSALAQTATVFGKPDERPR